MPPRRSHLKSRRGCLTCKQRRVKCDETGPPCGGCTFRSTKCEYKGPGSSNAQQGEESPTTASASTAPIVDTGVAIEEELEAVPSPPSDPRLLELQLMHRWSTVTYRSMRTQIAEDDEVWRDKVPTLAVRFDFLLDGVFALAAYEAAATSVDTAHRQRYVRAAVEYQTLALGSFQSHIVAVNPASFEATLCFSMILMVLALASSQFADHGQGESSMVSNTITHFELLRGCTVVMENNPDYLAKSPYVQRLKPFDELPKSPLDADAEAAIAILNTANERRSGSKQPSGSVSYEACQKALSLLEDCYSKCRLDVDHQGYVLGWLNMAGEGFIHAIKAEDQVALLVLMFWAVLVEHLGEQAWWTRGFGGRLVREISGRTLAAVNPAHPSPDDDGGLTRDAVRLARKMVHAVVSDEGRWCRPL